MSADLALVPGLTSISVHSWNGDSSLVALSPNTNEVWIYATNRSSDASKWERKYVLAEHGGAVSGIDWCPTTNLIVTCGHDRNAYVWELVADVWKPTLVILRINRAATCVKWSPAGNKFAVASGAKTVMICQFDSASNWWISKGLKKHKSTVLSLAWCINNKFLATGSADMKCRIFSAYIDGLDPAEDDGFGEVFPQQHEFGEVLAEFDQAKSWVHTVAWAPGGFRLAFGGHSSTMHFVQLLAGSAPSVQSLNCRDLPYLDLQFISDDAIVAAGYEANVDLFTVSGGSESEPVWSFKDKLDKAKTSAASPAAGAKSGAFAGARSLFASSDTQGHAFGTHASASSTASVSACITRHKNTIVNICLTPSSADASTGQITKFTTAGIDGRVCFWEVPKTK